MTLPSRADSGIPLQRNSGNLPVLFDGDLAIIDPDTGAVTALEDASDRALAHAADMIALADKDLLTAKRALAQELRDRYGVGVARAGGYEFTVAESQSWPVTATQSVLSELIGEGVVSPADAQRALPSKPKPDARALKALIGRLTVSNPEAAKRLADACTTSPPSVRGVRAVSVDAEEAA